MLPMMARILIKDQKGKRVRLWLPLFLLWPLLFIIFLLLLPFLLIVGLVWLCRGYKLPKVIPMLSSIFSLLTALRGLIVDIEDGDSKVKIIIN